LFCTNNFQYNQALKETHLHHILELNMPNIEDEKNYEDKKCTVKQRALFSRDLRCISYPFSPLKNE